MLSTKSSVLIWLPILTAAVVSPLPGQVSGAVRDSVKNGIPDATVTLSGDSGQIATRRTDLNGAFSFTSGESVGAVSIRAQADGYQSVVQMLSSASQVVQLRMRGAGFGALWHARIAQAVSVTLIRANGQRWHMGDGMGHITAPGALVAGEEFVLELTSYGSGSCTRADRVVVTADRKFLTIVVVDQVRGGACTMDRVAFPREIRHQFDELGTKVIRVVGLRGDRIIEVPVRGETGYPEY